MKLSAVIPAYNEEAGIEKVTKGLIAELDKIFARNEYEVLIIDDCSADKTFDVATSIQSNSNLHVFRHAANKGYGSALKTGIREAKGTNILIIDADCTYPLEEIKLLVDSMEDFEMVVGARIKNKKHIPLSKRHAKEFLRILASYLTNSDIKDINSGLRIFRKDIARSYFHILPERFSFTTTITMSMIADGYNVKFVPINYYAREGRSKIKPTDFWRFLALTLRTILYFNPLKVFTPLIIVSGGVGVSYFLFELLTKKDVGEVAILLILVSLQLLTFGVLADLIVRRTGRRS